MLKNNNMKKILINLLSVSIVIMLFGTVNGQSYTSGTSTVVTPSGTIVVGTVRTGFEYSSPVTNTVKQPVVVQQSATPSYGSQNISVYYEKNTITLNKQHDGPRNSESPEFYSESPEFYTEEARIKRMNKIMKDGFNGNGRYIPTDKGIR